MSNQQPKELGAPFSEPFAGEKDTSQTATTAQDYKVRFQEERARATYPSKVEVAIANSPHFNTVHQAFVQVLDDLPLSVAGATALSKEVALKLRTGDPEKGQEPLTDEQIAERVMGLAADVYASQALARAEYVQIPPRSDDEEMIVSFTNVVLHPADFGQLMTNLEAACVRIIEAEIAKRSTLQ